MDSSGSFSFKAGLSLLAAEKAAQPRSAARPKVSSSANSTQESPEDARSTTARQEKKALLEIQDASTDRTSGSSSAPSLYKFAGSAASSATSSSSGGFITTSTLSFRIAAPATRPLFLGSLCFRTFQGSRQSAVRDVEGRNKDPLSKH